MRRRSATQANSQGRISSNQATVAAFCEIRSTKRRPARSRCSCRRSPCRRSLCPIVVPLASPSYSTSSAGRGNYLNLGIPLKGGGGRFRPPPQGIPIYTIAKSLSIDLEANSPRVPSNIEANRAESSSPPFPPVSCVPR